MSKKRSKKNTPNKADISLLDNLKKIANKDQREMMEYLVEALKILIMLHDHNGMLESRVAILEREIAELKANEFVN